VGFELEARKKLGDNLLVGANYTFVDSKVTLSDTAGQAQTSLERALAGQSKNILNVLAEVRFGAGSLRALYNFADKRISDVGTVGLPDIYADGRGTLDMVLGYRLNRVNFRFSADNLTNEAYDYTQGDLLQRSYKLGRTFAFNLGFSAF
jgi:outer membrane receptor for monomeric catechols